MKGFEFYSPQKTPQQTRTSAFDSGVQRWLRRFIPCRYNSDPKPRFSCLSETFYSLREGRLLPKSAVEGEIDDGEYLGAAMRLTAELSRYAITQVTVTMETDEHVTVAGERVVAAEQQ